MPNMKIPTIPKSKHQNPDQNVIIRSVYVHKENKKTNAHARTAVKKRKRIIDYDRG